MASGTNPGPLAPHPLFIVRFSVVANPLAPDWLDASVDVNALWPGLWSANTTRDDEGEISVAGVSATELVAQFGTPVYVIDEAHARARAVEVREAFERELARVGGLASVYYAGKAFLCTEVARWVTEAASTLTSPVGESSLWLWQPELN
ncbi:MAG: hypothetical protein JJE28_03085, partial [Actinomycetales bacterium]|nr:hypothetical protein [Actinomycetales bacterium]